jgi:signal transduction histidine kinase
MMGGVWIKKHLGISSFLSFKKKRRDSLGMPIAKKIIEGHRGEIHIKSQPAKGIEVIVSLSVKQQTAK